MKVKLSWKGDVDFLELHHSHSNESNAPGLEKALRQMAETWIRDVMVTADHEDSIPMTLQLTVKVEVPIGDNGMSPDRTPRGLFSLLPSKEREILKGMKKEMKNHGK